MSTSVDLSLSGRKNPGHHSLCHGRDTEDRSRVRKPIASPYCRDTI